MLRNMLKDVKTTRVMNAVAAGTSDQDSAVLDMSGFNAVRFVLAVGDNAVGSVQELQVFGNTANSTSSPTPVELTNDELLNTVTATDSDNKLIIADVLRPAYQYVFARVKRGTANTVIDGIIADQYQAKDMPVTQGSTVYDSALIGPGV